MLIDGKLRNYIQTFVSYKTLIKTGDETLAAKKSEQIHIKIGAGKFTSKDARELLKDWELLDNKSTVFPIGTPSEDGLVKFPSKLSSIVSGFPITKTYNVWENILKLDNKKNAKLLSKLGKEEITESAKDYVEFEEASKTHAFDTSIDLSKLEVTVFLNREDIEVIKTNYSYMIA